METFFVVRKYFPFEFESRKTRNVLPALNWINYIISRPTSFKLAR